MTRKSSQLPLIPILRGIQDHEAVAIVDALLACGYDCIEVPLNSPRAFDTLALLRARFPEVHLGAGTVLAVDQVDRLADLGVDLILAPNFNAGVVTRALARGLRAMPGVATPSEAFAALETGATELKLFPAEMIQPVVLKAWRAVLPAPVSLFPVGGIHAENMASFLLAGADGFGFGSSVYAPGDGPAAVTAKAAHIRRAWDQYHGRFQT